MQDGGGAGSRTECESSALGTSRAVTRVGAAAGDATTHEGNAVEPHVVTHVTNHAGAGAPPEVAAVAARLEAALAVWESASQEDGETAAGGRLAEEVRAVLRGLRGAP